MNTLLFQYAVEIEKTGSITKAAQNLYMAQPNLSKAMKDLEKEIGYDIFRRTSGGIQVTQKGSDFLYHSRNMLEQMEELEKISQNKTGSDLTYKVAIPRGSYLANGFASFVEELSTKEGMDITINETNGMKTINHVLNQGYNMGIIRYQQKEDDYYQNYFKKHKLECETIWEFEYVLVMSKDHPLATKEEITCSDLEQYIKITHGDIEQPHEKAMERNFRQQSEQAKTIYVYERGSQFDLLTNLNNTYMWVSPIPSAILNRHNLVQRACAANDNKYKDVLIYRNDYQLQTIDKLFQKKLYESKVDVASTKYH